MVTEPRDLTTAEGARHWIEEMKTLARHLFTNNRGSLAPQVVFIATKDEQSGAPLDQPGMWVCLIDSPIVNAHGSAKDPLGLLLRRMGRRTGALGYAFLCEAWGLSGDGPRPSTSWEHVPGRKEVLRVQVEHHAIGAEQWKAEITRDRKGRASLGPWEGGAIYSIRGRLAGFLPTAGEIAAEAQQEKN